MIALTYRLTLEEPLLATALSGEPNSAVSYPFIPGSMIRGLVAGRWLAANPGKDLAVTARDWFFDEQVRYLHAYPCDEAFRRRLPAPLSWRKEKAREVEEGSLEDHALLDRRDSKFDIPKEVDGFATLDDEDVTLYTPKRHIAVHTLRDRFAGRPTGQRGAVYRYDALAPGEVLVGAILTPSKAIAEDLQKLLPAGYYRMGKAATAGYGLVHLEYPNPAIVSDWTEYEVSLASIPAGSTFVVTLLSDAILRNENGATHTDLAYALDSTIVCNAAFKRVVPLGGFNKHWGLPLPQTLALRAGSVFVLHTPTEIPENQVKRWLEEGIGERRAEGFGRLAIEWQRYKRLNQLKASVPDARRRQAALTGSVRTLAARMATRRTRQVLDRSLVEAINRITITRPPANSQLSRVRVIARSALQDGDLGRLSDLFKRYRPTENDPQAKNPAAMKENALKKFEAARVSGQRLSDWIVSLADNPQGVWNYFGEGRPAISLGGVQPEGELEREYAVRLIDGVLGKAMAGRRGRGGHDESAS